MKTLTKTPNQLPGIINVLAAPISQIQTLTDTSIQVDPDEVYHLKPSADSGQYTRSERKNKAGTYYHQLVSLFIQGLSTAKTLNLAQAVNHEFVLIIQNENGSWSRIGSIEEPFQLTVDVQTESPGLNIRFTAETTTTIFPLNTTMLTLVDLISDPQIMPAPTT